MRRQSKTLPYLEKTLSRSESLVRNDRLATYKVFPLLASSSVLFSGDLERDLLEEDRRGDLDRSSSDIFVRQKRFGSFKRSP